MSGAHPPVRDTQNLRRDEAAERSAALHVHGYDVELDLRSATRAGVVTFGSRTRIRFRSSTAATFLDLVAPQVETVTLNGRALDPAEVFDGNRITLQGLAPENEVVVDARCAYSHTGEGMHRFVDPVDDQTYLYTQYEPADARRVFATFEQPDLKAPFRFSVLAPSAWLVRSNTAGVDTPVNDTASRWEFPPTLPISTYITCVVAGPYHLVESSWRDVPLALLCRQSLAQHLDAEEIFAITRAGLDYFHGLFGVPYPFGRYDQAFVPEYNLGAMENPGLVTFTEAYVFHAAVTDAERERRATTILHEMAHMWFGNLVTMRWWDDLWLKESFADYMGSLATAEATRFTGAWTTFAIARKGWAYRQDELPSTHPVMADIVDLEAAKLNFDGITYAKGASVLKQLAAYVGRAEFLAGTRAYFDRHAYGNTTLTDFLAALEETSGRDLGEWSRGWLQTAGPSVLRAELVTDDHDVVTAATLRHDAVDPVTGAVVQRVHRLVVGCYDLVDDVLVRTRRLELDVTGPATELTELIGAPRPALVLVNDDDLTYARVLLDETSTHTAVTALGALPDALPRALVWSALWQATRDARLSAVTFLTAVARFAPGESHPGVLATLATQSRTALTHYLPPHRRDAATAELAATAWETATLAAPGSDAQLAWTRWAIGTSGSDDVGRLRGLLDGTSVPAGLRVDVDLRWAALIALAALGAVEEAELDAELAREDTALARRQRARALAGRPTPEAKAWAWQQLLEDAEHPNAMVDALAAGFARPEHAALVRPYEDRYLAVVERLWRERSIENAERLVVGLYPGVQEATAVAPTEPVTQHPSVLATDQWLARHADASGALRRLLIEQRAELVRSLRAQRVPD